MKTINTKMYRHYKNNIYKLLGSARHSETLEELALYEVTEPSDLGKTWVRPKDMFFETIDVKGEKRPRFEPVPFEIRSVEALSSKDCNDVVNVLRQVFEDYSLEMLECRLEKYTDHFLVGVFTGEAMVGFKWGYRLDSDCFYSALGGVIPEYQGFGLAQNLIHFQHSWCRDQGYKTIRTKTKNKWRPMLILNLKNDFQIVDTETRANGEIKIVLEKSLL